MNDHCSPALRDASGSWQGPAAPFFSAADGPVLRLSFTLGPDRGHAHCGGARRRRMAARIGPQSQATAGNSKLRAISVPAIIHPWFSRR
jgi:hypothetical protein